MIIFRHLIPQLKRVTRELTLRNPHALQARAATEFVDCVLLFESTVTIHARSKIYPADRILEVLLAELDCRDTFLLEAEGSDAAQAVNRIARLPMFQAEANHTPGYVPRSVRD